MWFVYLIKSISNNWYYVGSTNDIDRRLEEHNKGRVSSTKDKRPLVLVYRKQFETENDAREYERLLKDKRVEKERIIRELSK